MNKYIISHNVPLLEALSRINDLVPGPMVLFVVNEDKRMVGTLTDGDSRRALIAGASVNDPVSKVMHRNFIFLTDGVDNDVRHLHEQKQKKMHLIPVLDKEHHIIDIIDLQRFHTKLPIDAVIMAGGKGER